MRTRMLTTCLSFALSACGSEQAEPSTEKERTSDIHTALDYDAAWQAVEKASTAIPLTNGVAMTGLAGAMNSESFFYLDVPANTPVSFETIAGSGDADLYVKFGSMPNLTSYDCRPYLTGSNEMCNMAAKATAGRYYVMLRGFKAYMNVSLVGTY